MENKFADKTEVLSTDKDSSVLHKLVDEAVPLNATCKTIVEESIKSAPLFIAGSKGLALTLATHALAEMKDNSNGSERISQGLSGAGKGFIIRKGFDAFARLSPVLELLPTKYELALRGAGLGVVSRLTETAGTLDTWRDKQGNLDIAKGTALTGATVFSPVALGCDVVSFGLTKGMHVGLNAATKGLVDRNAMLSMSVMGTAFGMNGSTIGEYTRQLSNNEKLDWQKIGSSAFIGAASGGLSSLPGGYQMHLRAQKILKSMDYENKAHATIAPHATTEKSPTYTLLTHANQRQALRYADIVEPGDTKPMEFTETLPGQLDKLHKRLIDKPITTDYVSVWRPTNPSLPPGPNNGTVEQESCTFRNYSVNGHATQLSVTDSYAHKLESVREGLVKQSEILDKGETKFGAPLTQKVIRELSHSQTFEPETFQQYRYRLLPEDIVRHLDELPNSNLIKKILLLENNNPDDYKDSSGSITRADAHTPTGVMRLFALEYTTAFLRTMRHEWSHFLEGAYSQKFNAFSKAVGLENALNEVTKNPRTYGLHSESENWAVLGEALLDPQAKTFVEWLNKAPNRSCVYSLALADSLVRNPAETSIHKNQFENRTNFVQTELVPRLQENLVKELKEIDPTNLEGVHQRLGVLAEISGTNYAKQVTPLLRSTKSPDVIRAIVLAGLETFIGQPAQQADFLLALPKSNRVREVLADAIIDLPAETFTDHYFPKLKELESKSGSESKHFQQAFEAFNLRCWNEYRLAKSLPLEPTIYWLHKTRQADLTSNHYEALSILERYAEKAERNYELKRALDLYESLASIKQKMSGQTAIPAILAKMAELSERTGEFTQLERVLKRLQQQ